MVRLQKQLILLHTLFLIIEKSHGMELNKYQRTKNRKKKEEVLRSDEGVEDKMQALFFNK